LKQESARDVAQADSVDLVSAAKALSQATMAAAQAVGKPGVLPTCTYPAVFLGLVEKCGYPSLLALTFEWHGR
jgi:hypothetical protein